MAEEIEGDFVVPKPENTEEKETPMNSKPIFNIPTGKSRIDPETDEDEFDERTPKASEEKVSLFRKCGK